MVKQMAPSPTGMGYVETSVIDPALVMLSVSTGGVAPEKIVPLLDFMDEDAATKLRDMLLDFEPNPYPR